MITEKRKPDSSKAIQAILHPLVNKWFFSRFPSFSLPQKYGVLEIHSRVNVLVSAPTGATKTLTAFMAILNELVDSSIKEILEDKVYCIYVSPLKALNNDIRTNLLEPLTQLEKIYGSELGIRVAVRTGDTTASEKAKMLKHAPHILITTPESLAIVLNSPKFKLHLHDVQWFVADEIHALAENKRGVHLSLSMERLANRSNHMSRIGLSATVAPLEDVARYLVGTRRDCTIINVAFTKEMDLQVVSPVKDLINTDHETMHNALYDTIHTFVQQHKTTLIFTNTRAATERVVDYLKSKYPKDYVENIGAHHGSLSAEHRTQIERDLREGKLKVVVCSTSLELGIDIGYIDLVLCLGSPKSVARALQRIGRSGHQLHSTTKGRIIVLDRDDLVECAVLLKAALEKKIDRLHIPRNALDVLAQHLYGMAIEQQWNEQELFKLIKKSFCYATLTRSDFNELLDYLSGKFASLEDRHIYAKIWRDNSMIGKKGKLARVMYMTNIGTIPDQSGVLVKVGSQTVGSIDETFLERLRKGDVFILGGNTYQFRHAKGQVAYVNATVSRPPTVPSWVSEMLPLSFDLAVQIGTFRRLMEQKLSYNTSKEEILSFIHDYLYVDDKAAQAIYRYFSEQYGYLNCVPHDKKILVEHYTDEFCNKKTVFHTLYGRRVNDVLSRALGYAVGRIYHQDVEIGFNDNGFYLGTSKSINISKVIGIIKASQLTQLMEKAIDDSETLRRRFRHCAVRSLMILRSYRGKKKRVGRQQVSSMILLSAVKRISPNFSILREARREVLEDYMDITNAKLVWKQLESKETRIEERITNVPSPFAFKIVLQGVMDIIKIEDKIEFLKKMHNMVLAKIALKSKNKSFSYEDHWDQEAHATKQQREEEREKLRQQLFTLSKKIDRTTADVVLHLIQDEAITDEQAGRLRKLLDYEKQLPADLHAFLKKAASSL